MSTLELNSTSANLPPRKSPSVAPPIPVKIAKGPPIRAPREPNKLAPIALSAECPRGSLIQRNLMQNQVKHQLLGYFLIQD